MINIFKSLKQEELPQEESIMKPEVVSCKICKCLVNKYDAQKVVHEFFLNNHITYASVFSEFYCKKDIRPYNRKKSKIITPETLEYKYYKEIEVDEQGEPVGYKKIKN